MNTKQIVNYLIFIVLLYTNTVQATIYYVDASVGNDTFIGDETQPWKTIQKAANTLLAGDTVYIKAGTYTPTQKIEFLNSGTVDSYINYIAYPGDEHLVIIDGSNISLSWYGVVTIISKNYIKLSGLKVISSSYAGFFIDISSNIIIENNHTYETQSSGISVWESELVVVDNNEVKRACWPTGGLQECISIVKSNRVLVKNNHILDGGSIGFGGGGEGIDFKDGCANGIVYNNLVHDIASVGIYIDAYETNQSNIQVISNTVYNIFGVGIGTVSEEGGALKDVIVSKNSVYNCEGRALVIHWTNKPNYIIKNIYVHHNTFYNNAEGLDVGAHASGENICITNNIFSQNSVYQMQNSSTDFNTNELHIKNNILDGTNPSWALFGDDYILDNPEFINISTHDFHLQNISPAIDQGLFLTKTISSGAGNVLALEDVGFFTNGFGIKEGDFINIEGQSQQFEIVAIDYVNNTITINETTSWNLNDNVSLVYNDIAPDMGAFEYDAGLNLFSSPIENLVIFPNPSNDFLNLDNIYKNDYYQIISIEGNIVQKGKLNIGKINVAGIHSGVYILKIINSNTNSIRVAKMVKD